MHLEAYLAIRGMIEWVNKISPPTRIYEIGGREVMHGGVKHLFSGYETYHIVDLVDGKGVDVVADAKEYTPPFTPDCIVCCEVLEHCPDPDKLIAKCYEVLEPGGWAMFTFAGPNRPAHSAEGGVEPEEGEYYQGVGRDEAYKFFFDAGFGEIQVSYPPPLPPHSNFQLSYPAEDAKNIREMVAGLDTYVLARKVFRQMLRKHD